MPSRELLEQTRLLSEAVVDGEPNVSDYRLGYDGFGDLYPVDPSVNIKETAMGNVKGYLLQPAEVENDRTIVFFHGGGFAIGSLKSHAMIVTRLASWAKARVWFPLYGLAPEHPFPAAIDDCMQSWRWLLDADLDPQQAAFAGDSAGGGLMYSMLLRARDENVAQPACGWSICPWADMEGHGTWRDYEDGSDPLLSALELDWFAEQYLHGENLRHPWAAPIYGDLSGLPPTLIQVGGLEILRNDARTLTENLRTVGCTVEYNELPGAGHVWHHMVPDVPEANASIEQGVEFIVRHTS